MRSIATAVRTCGILLYLFLPPAHAADSGVVISDPLVGLYVSPARLDPLPEEARKAMKVSSGRFWIFAFHDDSVQTGDRYFIVRGREDMFGLTIVGHDGTYKLLGSAENFDSEAKLPERVVRSLARDAVARLIRVFGSKQALQEALNEKGGSAVVPAMADALHEAGITGVRKIGEKSKCVLWLFRCE